MNREILFRGKRNDTSEWVYGYLWSSRTIGCESPCCNVDEIIVDPSTVGQYTGLTDKNGVKIFEGDVLETYSGLIGRITFGAFNDDETEMYAYGWYWKGKDRDDNSYFLGLGPEWTGHKVIGNVHDGKDGQHD